MTGLDIVLLYLLAVVAYWFISRLVFPPLAYFIVPLLYWAIVKGWDQLTGEDEPYF